MGRAVSLLPLTAPSVIQVCESKVLSDFFFMTPLTKGLVYFGAGGDGTGSICYSKALSSRMMLECKNYPPFLSDVCARASTSS